MERIDDLLNSYKIISDTDLFLPGSDSVLLADFCEAKKHDIVMDLCTGNGIIAFLMHAKYKPKKIYGIEILKKSYDLCLKNLKLNNISNEEITFIFGDIKSMDKNLNSKFSLVCANPPYKKDLSGIQNENEDKKVARHEILCTLEDVLSSASKLLKFGGRFCMVHQPDRLCEIIDCMRKYSLEPKKLQFVHSDIKAKPSLMLIEAKKGSKPYINILPPIILKGE